jgi:hypothetical protein
MIRARVGFTALIGLFSSYSVLQILVLMRRSTLRSSRTLMQLPGPCFRPSLSPALIFLSFLSG